MSEAEASFAIGKDEMCVLCRERVDSITRGTYPVLDMQAEAELIQDIAEDYERRGLTGPQCRRCARLPVVA
jgi:hypothetical protein